MRAQPDILEVFTGAMQAGVGTQRSNCPREPTPGFLEGPCKGVRPGESAEGSLLHREEPGREVWTLEAFAYTDGRGWAFGGDGKAELVRHDRGGKTASLDVVVQIVNRQDSRFNGEYEWFGTQRVVGDRYSGHHRVFARPTNSPLRGDFCVDEELVKIRDCNELRGDITFRSDRTVIVRFDGTTCDRCGMVVRDGKANERWCWE